MPHTTLNPADLHDPVPFGYSHTAAVAADAELVFVAGQWGSDRDGAAVSSDFAEQVRGSFHNLGLALAAHGLDLGQVVQLRTYVVDLDLDKLGAISAAVAEHWGDTPPVNTLLGVAGLATPNMRFEVDAIAARTGG